MHALSYTNIKWNAALLALHGRTDGRTLGFSPSESHMFSIMCEMKEQLLYFHIYIYIYFNLKLRVSVTLLRRRIGSADKLGGGVFPPPPLLQESDIFWIFFL